MLLAGSFFFSCAVVHKIMGSFFSVAIYIFSLSFPCVERLGTFLLFSVVVPSPRSSPIHEEKQIDFPCR